MKRNELQGQLAMTVVLTSGAMLFATLFMGYSIYRSTATTWPPMGQARADLFIPTISTMLIALSSWFCHQMKIKLGSHKLSSSKNALFVTILLGWGFVTSQFFLWNALKTQGLFVSTGIFASILHAFTWIHAAHMILGLLGLHYLFFRMLKNQGELNLLAHNVEKFWHFLGIIWLIMYLIIFVF